jgi:GT2 family glycosyltransferase
MAKTISIKPIDGDHRRRLAPRRRDETSVMALILTYDAEPDHLLQCVRAVQSQSRPVATVQVTDNAGQRPAGPVLDGLDGNLSIHRLPQNVGPAGGHAFGLSVFLRSSHTHVWIMDDDCVPASDALHAMLTTLNDEPKLAFPTTRSQRGQIFQTKGWLGVLLPRQIVERVGLPIADLFWWAEDTEYLQWRIPRAGYGVVHCIDAMVTVRVREDRRPKPAWKYYYEARNSLYFRLHIQGLSRWPRTDTRAVWRRHYRTLRTTVKLAARAVVREPSARAGCLSAVISGAADGIRGRIGPVRRPEVADRPH